jgi:hypothetical protein
LGRSISASKLIAKHLQTPYVPPKPTFGPPFINERFQHTFKAYSPLIPIYYGPSGCGKSTAISNTLARQRGINYYPPIFYLYSHPSTLHTINLHQLPIARSYINKALGVIVISMRNTNSDDIAGSILEACGISIGIIHSITTPYSKYNKEKLDGPTFEATFKAAMVKYRKAVGANAKAIIVVEDIHSLKVLEYTQFS